MMQRLSEQILAHAEGLPEGAPVSAKGLLHLGNRAALDQALSRLAGRGRLIRAGRGVYVRPVASRFGTRAPSVEQAIEALASQRGEVIVPNGAAAANALGLTTQVPVRPVYLTSGRTRSMTLGKQVVELRHAPRWQLALANRQAGQAVRALAWLGPDKAEAALETLKRKMPPDAFSELVAAAPQLPTWLARCVGPCPSVHGARRMSVLFAASPAAKLIAECGDYGPQSPRKARRMTTYIHALADWPKFHWSHEAVATRLAAVRHRQGRLIGRMEGLGFSLRAEAVLQSLTEEILKSNEIEGEGFDREQVRSSIARRLGMDIGALAPVDRNVDGVVEMMLDATQNYAAPLTKARLFDWHAALFPSGRIGMMKIRVGAWRDGESGPMQVVSGPVGRHRVHYEAPAAPLFDREMRAFLAWFNGHDSVDPVLRAAVAHLWFVTIHPFDDGNGRIARAIADMALARSEQSPQRFYSMSAQIRIERQAYYDSLETTQKGDLDITAWILWFVGCLDRAFDGAEIILASVLMKARFWERHAGAPLNDRQRLVLGRLLGGFEGKLTSSKYAKLARCSQDTASRDIDNLIAHGILTKDQAGGRSTRYTLAPVDP